MSGGSMDYICYRVEEAASMCEDVELAELLRDAANVLHDEEWWKSGDYSEDAYRESLAEFKAKWFKGNRADRLKGYVDKEIDRCRIRCYSIIGPVILDDVLRGEENPMKPSEFWNDNRTEREFEENGLQCCTRTHDLGHRCGYVALPKGHPLFGKGWDACYEIAPELDVDGGITFANGTDEMWILGWDAAHAWHRRDWSIASDNLRKRAEERPELYADFDWFGDSYMVDADMAEAETRRFARQLAALRGEGEE